MKKYIIMCCALVAVVSLMAQQLPNSNFEDWSGAAFDGNIQPASWNYSNVTQFGFKFNFAHRETGHSGYCALIQDQEVGAAGIVETSPGYMALGQPFAYVPSLTEVSLATAGTYGGISFKNRPDSMKVWIKRTGPNVTAENYNIVFYTWKGTAQGSSYTGKNGNCTSVSYTDEESDIRQATDGNVCKTTVYAKQIAEGWAKEKKAYNDWTLLSIPIYYLNDEIPDKCNVIFSAGNYPNFRANSGLYAGNSLYVDDVELVYSSNIDELYINNKKWSGFDPQKNQGEEQTKALGVGATEIPSIFAKRGAGSITNCKGATTKFDGRTLSGSEIKIDASKATVGGEPVVITVTSEDGRRTSVYKIKFVAEESSNFRPKSMSYKLADGTVVPVPNFSGYVTSYNVELDYGTTQVPTISASEVGLVDNQSVKITNASGLPGSTTVVVTAENGTSQTYTINFTVGKLKDTTLKNILVGGEPLTGFSATKTTYTVELPLGTTSLPTIEAVSAYKSGEQTIVKNNGVTIEGESCTGTYTISVTVPGNATTRTYTLKFKITASTYSYLKDLKVGGATIEGFSPEILSYYITLPQGTKTLPAITWTQGDAYQDPSKTTMVEGGIDGTTKITVTAASGATSTYKIIFSTFKSSVNWLEGLNIAAEGTLSPAFDKGVFSYTYELPIGTTDMPAITYTVGDEYQTITKTEGGINGTTRIVVKAEDGSSNVYVIAFSVKQANSTALKSLSVEGHELNYSASQYEYNITLSRGTTTLPTVTYEAELEEPYQKVSVKDGGVNGDYKIIVKAQSGASATYIIHFQVEKSSDNSLRDIKIGGVSLEGFDADTLYYNIELPSGTTSMPKIATTKNESSQVVTIVNGGVNGTTTIAVTAENGDVRTYVLNFMVMKSANAYVEMIYIGGDSLQAFDKETFNYVCVLDTTVVKTCPSISVDKEAGQSVVIVKPSLLGAATIKVTSESGASNTYTLRFSDRSFNTNNRLQNILVDGVALANFRSDSLTYNYELPNGTTVLPNIEPVKADSKQEVSVMNNGVNGTTTIAVLAEDGSRTVYELNFSVVVSHDATLRTVTLNGVELDGFASDKFEYTNTLAVGTTTSPVLAFERNHAAQSVTVVEPILAGTTTIVVVAEDGVTSNTYTIQNQFALRSNATLEDIKTDGSSVRDFANDKTNYEIELEPNASSPEITYESREGQFVGLAESGLDGSQIVVGAEDGSKTLYEIAYDIQPNTNALLSDIKVYNGSEYVSLAGFSSSVYEYVDSLAWRTSVVPNIYPVAATSGQVITINYSAVNDTTHIHVLAENKTNTADYYIYFPTHKSSVTALGDLFVDEAEFTPAFAPDVLEYVATLPYGTKQVPAIRWVQGEDDGRQLTEQVITASVPSLQDTTKILVTAEDGSQRTYAITYVVRESGMANVLNTINIGGVNNFDGTSATEFDVELPYGSVSLPEIMIVKNYEEQSVLIDNGGAFAPTTITVKSNQAGIADKVYTITPHIVAPKAELTWLTVNGDSVALQPNKYQYVVRVDNGEGENPTLAYDYNHASAEVDDSEIQTSTKKVTIPVTSAEDGSRNVYTIYYHYTQDTIPNGEFTSWSAAQIKTSVSKPTGWFTMADATGDLEIKSSATLFGLPIGSLITKGTYKPDNAVTQQSGYVRLRTINESTLDGSIPGQITLGEIGASLNDGSSTTSVFGGMMYRNTPDAVSMRYNPVSKSNVSNIHFVYNLNNGAYSKEFIDKNFTNTWKEMTLSLLDNTIESPSMMNIIINSCNNENASALSGSASSEMLVDWVRFAYSSKISKILVNGKTTSGFRGKYDQGWVQAIVVDADLQGIPQLTFVGEVADQEYNYYFDDEVDNCSGSYRTRVAYITAIAEDGITMSHYVVDLNRPKSTNVDLATIIVNGDTLSDFAANKLSYVVTVPNGTIYTPDVMAVRGSMHQTVSFEKYSKDSVVLKVVAESGATKTYTLKFVESKANDAMLANIDVEANTIDFDPEINSYDIVLANGAMLPQITFTKNSDGQTVTLDAATTTTLRVVAEDGVTTNIYTLNFAWGSATTSGKLTDISVEDITLEGYSKDLYAYTYKSNGIVAPTCTREFDADTVCQILTSDSILWNVQGTSAHVYKLALQRELSNNTNLAAIIVNGDSLAGFSNDIDEYFVESNEAIEVSAYAAEDGQHIFADFCLGEPISASGAPARNGLQANANNILATFTFKVVAADGTTTKNTYVKVRAVKSNDALLDDILLNGASLSTTGLGYTADKAFEANTMAYDVLLTCASPKLAEPSMPNITVKAGDSGQTIKIENNGLNETSYITVTAEDGVTENNYSIKFTSQKSSNADLTGIAVNYVDVVGFSASTTDYEVQLTSNDVPEVTYTTADKFQQDVELIISKSQATITVTAEDGTQKTYSLTFQAPIASSYSLLNGIDVDGTPLGDFEKDKFDGYVVSLPAGTEILPDVTVVSGCDGQSVEIQNSDNLANTNQVVTSIVVTAEDGESKSTYKVTFNVELSANDTLAMIYLNNDSLITEYWNVDKDFAKDVESYVVTLPVGTRTLPTITYDKCQKRQVVTIDTVAGGTIYDQTIQLVVTAEQQNTRTYAVRFVVEKSAVDTLSDLRINDFTIETSGDGYTSATEFASRIYSYELSWAIGSREVPAIDWTAGDEYQTVALEHRAQSLDNDSDVVLVTAENGTIRRYVVNYTLLRSDVDTLKALYFDNTLYDEFRGSKVAYDYTLPYGTTALPEITWECGDAYQIVDTLSNGVNGKYVITVTADNGTKRVYTIDFSVEKSDNSNLSNIYVAGSSVAAGEFDGEVYEYNVKLPYGTSAVPATTYDLGEEHQQVVVTTAASFADTTLLVVTAENGVNTSTYKVSYEILPSSNTALSMIYINDQPIDSLATVVRDSAFLARGFVSETAFASDMMEYSILLPYGTTEYPNIKWDTELPIAAYNSVTLTIDTVAWTGKITLVAQTEDESEYFLSFLVAESSNSKLAGLYTNGHLVDGFNPDSVEYHMVYPVGTDSTQLLTLADVSWVEGDNAQTVTAVQTSRTEILITVTAGDGSTSNYVIILEILKSSNSYLKDILIDGTSFHAFEPDITDYVYMLKMGVESLPTYEGIRSDSTQTVDYGQSDEDANVKYIFCTAEDGSETRYSLTFIQSDVNPGDAPTADDVCWTPMGNGYYKAATTRNAVYIVVFDVSGRMLTNVAVPLADPNDDICDPSATGTTIHVDKTGKVLIYAFLYNSEGKKMKVVSQGKFIY